MEKIDVIRLILWFSLMNHKGFLYITHAFWHTLLIFLHLQGWNFHTEPPSPKVPHFWQATEGDCVPWQALSFFGAIRLLHTDGFITETTTDELHRM